MAIEADRVVIELEARNGSFNAAVRAADNTFQQAASNIERSALRAERQVVASSGAMANAQRNLGRQISDIGVGLSSPGVSPFLVLAQQAPQVADALADTGGKAAQVAAFFAGPWGAALLAAASVFGTLAAKSLETGESIESLVAKLKENAARTEAAAEADRVFAQTQAGLRAQINAATNALNEQNASLRTNAQLRNVQRRSEAIAAEKGVADANDRVRIAEARLRQAAGANSVDTQTAAARRQAREELAAARTEALRAREDAKQAAVNLNRSRVYLAAEEAAAEATATGKITKTYDDRIRALQRVAIARAQEGKQVGEALKRQILALEQAKNSEIAAYQEAESAKKKAATKGAADARRAEREEAAARKKAAREQIAEAKELASTLESLRQKFDPATAAAHDFAETISDIERVRLAGLISDLEAIQLKLTATAAEAKRISEIDAKKLPDAGDPIGDNDRRRRERVDQEMEDRAQAEARLQEQRERNVYDLADIFETAFNDGSKGLWEEFKRQGLRALSVLIARWVISKIGKFEGGGDSDSGGGGAGSLIGSIISSVGLPKFAGGGSMMVGGFPGTDRNVLSINGQPRALVGAHELINVSNPNAAAARSSAGSVLHQTIHVDARGAVMNDQFATLILSRANQNAADLVGANNAAARKSFPAAQDRFAKLGTTG